MLDINMEFHKGILFVELDGELSFKTSDKLKSSVIDVFEGVSNIVYDLSKITKIDMYGINVLKSSRDLCRSNHGKLMLCGMDDYIKDYIKENYV